MKTAKITKFMGWPPEEDMVGYFPTKKKRMKYRFELWTSDIVIWGHIAKDGTMLVEGHRPNLFKWPKKKRGSK